MKIRISDISKDGLRVKDTLSLEALNARIQVGQHCDMRFETAPEVELLVTKTQGGGILTGTVKSRINQPCGLCLRECCRDLAANFDFVLQPKPAFGEESDDIGVLYYEGEHVELEETIQECLILQLSQYWHPEIKKDGSCTLCLEKRAVKHGTSLNGNPPEASKLKLADLLKKAGVN